MALGTAKDATSWDVGRLDVRSSDGTRLAVWLEGTGPPMVLVHGSLQDHTISAAFVAALRSDVTTYAMDRRGFGASGDAPGYAIEREFEDVAAVVDAVAIRAASAGEPVALWGHSYGANLAMGGANLTDAVGHLVLYEPSLGLTYPPGCIDSIERALAHGDHDGAIVAVLRDVLEFTEEEIDTMRSGPEWAGRLATAPTVAREAHAEEDWVYRRGQFDRIAAPTLFLSGSQSPPEVRRATDAAVAAVPAATVRALDGHAHIAHRTDPAMVAAIVREFIAT